MRTPQVLLGDLGEADLRLSFRSLGIFFVLHTGRKVYCGQLTIHRKKNRVGEANADGGERGATDAP
ncbi:MAG: hypothetical protein DMG38_07085 [Acidobacteria bacterium]|nr:MAG: hypothetical protein DMG38_07085 [Acidobacteriota bacterium]